MTTKSLTQQFCTPPAQGGSDIDQKIFGEAIPYEFEFESRLLKGYALGAGPTVLLMHGWGSRASHMALLIRVLIKNNFRIVTFDGPAHGKTKIGENDMSNMFEFGRALSHVARSIGEVYAVIGHSLGAMAAAFVMSGTGYLSNYKFNPEKLVLISPPASILRVIENFCKNRNEIEVIPELTNKLEMAFNFKVDEYNMTNVLQNIDSEIMIIHDEDDKEMPVQDSITLKNKFEQILLAVTKGYGHHRILANREVLRQISKFLKP